MRALTVPVSQEPSVVTVRDARSFPTGVGYRESNTLEKGCGVLGLLLGLCACRPDVPP